MASSLPDESRRVSADASDLVTVGADAIQPYSDASVGAVGMADAFAYPSKR